MITDKKYRIFGIRRSGNHAIINWLRYKSYGSLIHFNDCHIQNNHTNDRNIFFYNNKKHIFSIIRLNNNKRKNIKLDNLIKKKEHTDFCIISYENKYVNSKFNDNVYSDFKKDIIILRDPYNLLASILKHPKLHLNIKEFQELWMHYAEKFIETNNFIKINYNNWFTNNKYRNDISKKLNLNTNDEGKNIVSHHGSGSSFDKQNFNQKAQQMDVLNRWRVFQKDKVFLSYLNKDIINLSQKLFKINI